MVCERCEYAIIIRVKDRLSDAVKSECFCQLITEWFTLTNYEILGCTGFKEKKGA